MPQALQPLSVALKRNHTVVVVAAAVVVVVQEETM